MNNPSTCPHFKVCSGCTLKNMLNLPIFEGAKTFFEKQRIHPNLRHSGFEGVRYKAKLAVRKGPTIGLFKKNSHEVIPIPKCLIHHPSINTAVQIIQKEMIAHQITGYDEISLKGTLRYIQLFVEKATNQVQLVLILNDQKNIEPFCKSLQKYELWHSIFLNEQKGSTNQIIGPHWEHVFGKAFLWQQLGEVNVPFHPGAFSQTHLPLFEEILRKIQMWVRPNDRVLELYAGVGVIGLNLEKKVKSVVLVENNPFAYQSFQEVKSNLTYHLMDAKEADLTHYDLTIVDPPRKGLDPQLLNRLESERLIYISCGFDSFKKDAEKLISLGWKIKDVECFLLFPGSNHIETVALFERSNSAKLQTK